MACSSTVSTRPRAAALSVVASSAVTSLFVSSIYQSQKSSRKSDRVSAQLREIDSLQGRTHVARRPLRREIINDHGASSLRGHQRLRVDPSSCQFIRQSAPRSNLIGKIRMTRLAFRSSGIGHHLRQRYRVASTQTYRTLQRIDAIFSSLTCADRVGRELPVTYTSANGFVAHELYTHHDHS